MRTTLLLLTALCLLMTGCSYDDLAAVEIDQLALLDGSPEGIALLAFVNDPATTVAVLDDDVPLDRRAAEGIVAARAITPFATVAEVDAVPYVGPSAINRLASFAQALGLAPAGEDELGTWDGVTFTVNEAAAVLALANGASLGALDDDLGLDSRAAESIVAAQPVPSVAHLAGLYYVGANALNALLDAIVVAEPPAEEPPAEEPPAEEPPAEEPPAEEEPPVEPAGPSYEDQFVMDEAHEIPDGGGQLATVNTVAGVPDVEVAVTLVIDLDHEAPGELSITLTDPRRESIQVDVTGESISQSIWTDGTPNGYWVLQIEDGVPGFSGDLLGWSIEVVSLD